MSTEQSPFGNKLRVRVCGLLVKEGKVLLAQIHSPVTDGLVWTPPGGGVEFRESMRECLKREFKEETNLSVKPGKLVHVNELIRNPYHVLECFFEVEKISGQERMGKDPELSWDRQLLHDLQWISISELTEINFVPPALIKKLQDWDNYSDLPFFSEQ